MKAKSEKRKAKSENLKLKTLGIIMSCFFLLVSCAQEEKFDVAENEPLVYLQVESAEASSFDTTPDWAPKPDAMAPADRDMLTRWSSELGRDNEWIYFDLGSGKVLSKIVIKWESAYATDYDISISQDGKTWKKLVLMENQNGGVDEILFSPRRARFVKITALTRFNPQWGFSIWEFEMYGPKSLNPGEKEIAPEEDLEKKKKELKEKIAKLKTPLLPVDPEAFQKGVVYTSWSAEELLAVASDLELAHLKEIGVDYVAIMVPTYQNTVDSTIIVTHDYEGGDTPTDEAISHAIDTCHLLGIRVMLKPHVDCIDGTPRVNIIGSPAWFESYKKMILRYAKMAEEKNAEIFCVGTELENTTFSAWEVQWRDIIRSIGEVYRGYTIYAANWTEYEGVNFWDMLDFVGIDAYFPLTNKKDPTEEELVGAWQKNADKIEKWLDKNNIQKGVIFTELGYVSSDGTNKQPWATLSNPEDQKEQADSLNSTFEVLTGRPWFKGIYLWQYFPQERWSPLGFTIKDKLAEEVVKKWYKEGGTQ